MEDNNNIPSKESSQKKFAALPNESEGAKSDAPKNEKEEPAFVGVTPGSKDEPAKVSSKTYDDFLKEKHSGKSENSKSANSYKSYTESFNKTQVSDLA